LEDCYPEMGASMVNNWFLKGCKTCFSAAFTLWCSLRSSFQQRLYWVVSYSNQL